MTSRPPVFVSRETGARELDISTDTWDEMVKIGALPEPIRIGTTGKTPRWRWEDVESALCMDEKKAEPEPFFREDRDGKKSAGGRDAA